MSSSEESLPPSASSSPPTSPDGDSSTSPPKSYASSSPPPPIDDSSSPPPPIGASSSPVPSSEASSPPSPSPSSDGSPPPSSNQTNDYSNYSPPPAAAGRSHRSSPPYRTLPVHDGVASARETFIIAGASAGAVLMLFLLAVLIFCVLRRKRKPRDDEKYFRDDSYRTGSYYNNNGQYRDHTMKMPSHYSAGMTSEYGWPLGPPPPPPPMMNSGDMCSAGFSLGPTKPPPHPAMSLGYSQSSFAYQELAAATGGFSSSNLLGQGGFGYVHKGVLPNGKEVAVKSLKLNSGQGEREFQAEVDIISRVHHRYLVSLVGYCIAGNQRMLVYEFVNNGTLEYHLYGAGRPCMDWSTRLKIALGAAKGFAYLHEDCSPRIIHRDIKAANILLDSNFDAKVADFGLAKLSEDSNTHVSTRIMGTFGYLAPEYASSGKLTEKSDVYSFGIVLLELITGRRPVDMASEEEDNLVDWAEPILKRAMEGGSFNELVDPRLGNNYDEQEMRCLIFCVAASIRHSARRRPKMSQIVRALEGDASLDDLSAAIKQGSLMSGSSSEYDLPKLEKNNGALSSQELGSNDEGQTDEISQTSH